MHLLPTIVIGFGAGLFAKFLTPGRGIGRFVASIIIGVIGAVGATYVGRAFGTYGDTQSAGLAGVLIGAVVLLLLYHLIVPRKSY